MPDKPTEDTPPPNASADLDWEAQIARLHELAVKTQNPMYAWHALDARFHSVLGMLKDKPIGEEFSIPGWVADYLLQVVENLRPLSSGIDVHAKAPDREIKSPESYGGVEAMFASPEWQQHMSDVSIPLDDAMKRVPAALGLTRKGWNAFDRLNATTDKMHGARSYAAMRAQGVPSKVALHAIGSVIGVGDPSALLARFREVSDLLESEVGEPTR